MTTNENQLSSRELKFCMLASVFMASWGMMQLMVVKLIPADLTWLGLGVFSFAYSEFLFALTFPITDVVTEVWGAKRARQLVFAGVIVYAFVMAMLWIATKLPAPEYWAPQNDAYTLLFSSAPRIWLASITAIVFSQLLDIKIFNAIRSVTNGRWLWLRNNGSTLVSQAVDTLIFYTIAFYGLVPDEAFIALVVGNYLLKIVLAALDTPVVYWLVHWARGPNVIEEHKES